MRLNVAILSEFRRRKAQAQRPAPLRVPFEQNTPIRVPLRTSQTEAVQVVLKIREDHGEGLSAEQALELGQALIDAAASVFAREGR